jgi:hypothetical protein
MRATLSLCEIGNDGRGFLYTIKEKREKWVSQQFLRREKGVSQQFLAEPEYSAETADRTPNPARLTNGERYA